MCVTTFIPLSLRTFLHDLHKPGDVYACYRVMFVIAFLIGITPFQFSTQPKRHLKNTIIGYLNTLARIVLYSFVFYSSMTNEQSIISYFYVTTVSRFTDSLQKFNGMFAVIMVYLYSLLERQALINVIENYELLELHFSRVGVQFHQNKCAFKINTVIILMLLANLLFFIYGHFLVFAYNGIYLSWIAILSFYSPHLIMSVVVVIFCTILHKITLYLNAVNKVLKNLCHQWDTRSIKAIAQKQRSLQCLDSFSMYTIVSKNPAEIIQESMEIHQLICEAASTANKYFTYQLLTIISIAFLIIVFDAYYVLETLLGKSKRESKFKTVEFVTFFSCQMILYLIAIISIVEGSNRAIKKSEKTGGIVHALLNKAKTADVKEKLQQFSMQLMHLKINFTAAGLFNIDRTLYFTISGALTTYLIILLQFTSNTPTVTPNGCDSALAIATNHSQT
ncbi:gustatory receptor 28b isoform 1-T1 [Cochliomyia hominivorax]